MRNDTLLRKMALPESALESIKTAVRDAEVRTTGEIALAVSPESSDYSFFELFASVMLGAVSFAVLLPFHGAISAFVGKQVWLETPWHTTAAIGIFAFAVIAISFSLANLPAIDRLVIPRDVMKRRVYNRALRHFVESGVYATAERTGILVFISYMEREVRIIADEGISSKIAQAEWDAIAAGIASGIGCGKTGEALVEAVGRCGALLAEHFPAKKENPNELPNGLVLLEAGE